MPRKNETFYKRFNVGQYMRQKRLGWLAVEEKSKKLEIQLRSLSDWM